MTLKILKIAQKRRRFLSKLILLFLFLVLAGLLFKFKGLFVVALVNHRPISRYSLDRELEKQAGKQVLENLISRALITQEAKRQKVVVSPQELEERIKEVEERLKAQGTNLENVLQIQGLTRKDIEDQLRIQLMVEKILGSQISVSEEELKNYFEENKNFYPKETKFEEIKADLEKQLGDKKIAERFRLWLEELRNKGKIYYFLKF